MKIDLTDFSSGWLVCWVGLAGGRAVLSENGYSELVVGVSPDLPESEETLQQLRGLLTEVGAVNMTRLICLQASRELYKVTRRRAYFRRVTVLWFCSVLTAVQEGDHTAAPDLEHDTAGPAQARHCTALALIPYTQI